MSMASVRSGMRVLGALGSAAAVLAVAGCTGLTRDEAREALDEASVSAEAASLVGASVEIYTDFTIGGAVEAAAAELRTFVETQLPCAEVTLEGSTLTVVYGARPGTCTYRGQTYSGSHTVTVMRNQMDDVVVSHQWAALSNQRVSVTGSAMVTWSFTDRTRHVSHELEWTRLSDGRTGVGTGDRTQAALDGGLVVGFVESGERTWTGSAGTWTLSIEDVEMRWVDPCPQAGRYVLESPAGKTLTLSFERSAPTTITVTIASGGRSYDLDVTTLPASSTE